MDGYYFWQDLFDTLQSFPDWLKLIALIIPPGFVLGLAKIISTHRLTRARISALAKATTVPQSLPMDELHSYLPQGLHRTEVIDQDLTNRPFAGKG